MIAPMKMRGLRTLLSALATSAATLLCTQAAHAESPKPTKETFALIVTNNRSYQLSRQDLRYADDDGAKYYETMRVLAPEANVLLHTEFDADSEKLFPAIRAKAAAPSVAKVTASARDLAERVRAANAAGKETEFYFIFAGHGDVDEGKGFLEFQDGRFSSENLEALLRAVPAKRSHVILDSCNSFFVVNSRKAGGRRFLTAQDAAEQLRSKLPHVGFFLSTSAKGEVFEWSEIQSGVFSHAVRSGLLGGADASGDGIVSYEELKAFVHVAAQEIKNPNVRPHVFARGPGGVEATAIFDARESKSKTLVLDSAARRVTLFDKDAVPWIDLHKEAGAITLLRVPTMLETGEIVELDARTAKIVSERSIVFPVLPAASTPSDKAQQIAFADLSLVRSSKGARGASQLFEQLFERPFGRAAMQAAYAHPTDPAKEVYGVSPDDVERMTQVVSTLGEVGRNNRVYGGLVRTGVGASLTAFGSMILSDAIKRDEDLVMPIVATGIGGTLLLSGVIPLLGSSEEEDIRDRYFETLRKGNYALLSSDTERTLLDLRDSYHSSRIRMRVFSGILGGLFVAGSAATVISAASEGSGLFSTSESVVLSASWMGLHVSFWGALFAGTFFKHSNEELVDHWLRDPSLRSFTEKPAITVRPNIGMGSIGLSGTFW